MKDKVLKQNQIDRDRRKGANNERTINKVRSNDTQAKKLKMGWDEKLDLRKINALSK